MQRGPVWTATVVNGLSFSESIELKRCDLTAIPIHGTGTSVCFFVGVPRKRKRRVVFKKKKKTGLQISRQGRPKEPVICMLVLRLYTFEMLIVDGDGSDAVGRGFQGTARVPQHEGLQLQERSVASRPAFRARSSPHLYTVR